MLLSDLNTFDPRLSSKNVFLVSLGAIEQHGRFAPMGTDNFIQEALLDKVQAALPEVIYLPHIPIGPSWQHLGFKGTISLQPATLYSIVKDIVDSLQDSARMIVFVSWHGGNKPTVADFIEKEKGTYPGLRLEQITFGDEDTDVQAEKLLHGPTDDHAGNTEVSLALALRPDITSQPQSSDDKHPLDFDWDQRIIEVRRDGTVDEHPSWVASPEIGQELIAIYSDNLITKLRKLLTE